MLFRSGRARTLGRCVPFEEVLPEAILALCRRGSTVEGFTEGTGSRDLPDDCPLEASPLSGTEGSAELVDEATSTRFLSPPNLLFFLNSNTCHDISQNGRPSPPRSTYQVGGT